MAARVIQDEPLVGDTRFWKTRPYVWYKLLTAKLLFLFVSVSVPLMASQIVLLVAAGADLLPNLGRVILVSLAALLFGVTPLAAIATVTRNFRQWISVAVIFVLVAIVTSVQILRLGPNRQILDEINIVDVVEATLFLGLMLIGMAIQYSNRERSKATIALVLAVVLVPAIAFLVPRARLIQYELPLANPGQIPLRLTPVHPSSLSVSDSGDSSVPLFMGLGIAGIPDGMLLKFNGAMISIEHSGRTRWDFDQATYSRAQPDIVHDSVAIYVDVDGSRFQEVQATPTDVRLTLAFSMLRDQNPHRAAGQSQFEIPKVGRCWSDSAVHCRVPIGQPSILMETYDDRDFNCPGVKSWRKEVREDPIHRNLPYRPNSALFSPIELQWFSARRIENCSEYALTFSEPELIQKFRVELDLGKIMLKDYVSPIAFD